MIQDILKKKEIEFFIGDYQAIGIVYTLNGQDYVVTAAAYDGYGYNHLRELKKALIILFVTGLSILFITCYFLAYTSLRPIRNIIKEMENITTLHIKKRLSIRNRKDEIGELSTSFNALLDRLEASFNSQKMFVSNVSHELRTPLASLMAELDLSLQKERTGQQYRQSILNALKDAQRMNKLIDGLLNLAKADYQKEQIKMEPIRLDELLLDTRSHILKAHPDYHIELIFEQEAADDDRMITIQGNLYLLNIAFANLMENNCKYSADKSSIIQISYWDKWTIVRLSDDGIGMSASDLQNMFTLFYRGNQDTVVEGHGIGMTLSQKIIHLHQGKISVYSEQGKGTTFVVELPHI